MNNYIVYEVTYKSKTVYVGSGKHDRYLHTSSGHSHNAELNKLFFTDPCNIVTTILRSNLTKEESLEIELGIIAATSPPFNIVGTKRHGSRIINAREANKRKRKCKVTFK